MDACDAYLERSVDEHHRIEVALETSFEQQGYVVNDHHGRGARATDRIGLLARPAADARMDDRLEPASRRVILERAFGQRTSIDARTRCHVVAERVAQFSEDGRVDEGSGGERIRVDDGRPARLEATCDGRFARPDVSGQTDLDRHGLITPRWASLTLVPRFAPFAWLRRLRTEREPLADWPTLDRFGPRPHDGIVVGGAVRDALLGRPSSDVDWLVPDAERAAYDLAERTEGHAFALDRRRGHWRVTHDRGTVDLIRRDLPVEEDLAHRDFTIGAMAIGPNGAIDPLSGRDDLAARRLVRAGPSSLEDDVLRGLRGVRLAATLNLTWDATTRRDAERVVREALAGERPLPAAERMRDELVELLFVSRPGDALADAHAIGWLEALMPELVAGDGVTQGGLHHLDVLQHQLEALQRLASGFPDADLATRLATLLHDVAKPACRTRDASGRLRFDGHASRGAEMTSTALRRLRFDGTTADRAAALVRRHMLPLPRDEREARRFAHRRRALLPGLLQLMVADREASRGRLSSEGGRRAYRTALARILAILDERPPSEPLLDGREVMERLGLEPGPRVGEALAVLAEAQAVGDVTDHDDAVAALHRYAAAQGWTAPSVEPP